jgi:hypothetical protein
MGAPQLHNRQYRKQLALDIFGDILTYLIYLRIMINDVTNLDAEIKVKFKQKPTLRTLGPEGY